MAPETGRYTNHASALWAYDSDLSATACAADLIEKIASSVAFMDALSVRDGAGRAALLCDEKPALGMLPWTERRTRMLALAESGPSDELQATVMDDVAATEPHEMHAWVMRRVNAEWDLFGHSV